MRLVEREQYSVSIQLMMRKKLSLSSLLVISFSKIVALLSSRRSLRSRNVLRMMSASSLASFPLMGTPYIDHDCTYSEDGYVPDWQFMEDYIKSLKHKPLTTQNKKNNIQELNVIEWQEFYVSRTPTQSGLFDIENCKCGSAGTLDDGNDINYIGAKKNDNGVMRKVVRDESLVSRGNGIMFICDGEGSVGYTNYMDEDFIGSTTTSIGYDEALNPYIALFIVSILDKEKFKFSYGRKYRAHINEVVIKLPIQRNISGLPVIDTSKKYSKEGYVPDWQFMEDYIRSLPYGDRL